MDHPFSGFYGNINVLEFRRDDSLSGLSIISQELKVSLLMEAMPIQSPMV